MDKIIEILEKNRLYDDRSKIPFDYNKIDKFIETYTYNKTNIHPLPKDINRNKDGHIELLETPFLISNNIVNGHANKFWILLNNGSKILLKEVKETKDCELELLFDGLAKQLNIPVSENNILKIGNLTYLGSSSFLNQNEYLFNEYNLKKDVNQIEKVGLYKIRDILKQVKNLSIRDHIYKTLFIDRLTDNFDRIPNNFKTIMSNYTTKVCPLYDNDKCCDNDLDKKELYTIPAYKSKFDSKTIFTFLLNDNNFYDYIIKQKNEINIDKICTDIYSDKKITISQESTDVFSNTVNKNKDELNEYIKVLKIN